MGRIKRHPIISAFIGILLVLFICYIILVVFTPVSGIQTFGVTFSAFYAEKFGIDWKEAYIAILDDLGARHIRIPAYWNEIEPVIDSFTFENLDWQIMEAKKREADIILVVGRKLPRWPECHTPEWTEIISKEEKDERLLRYITQTILRYRDSSTIIMWQIENEPFLPFGECYRPDEELLAKEIALVRALDDRPIIITASGELESWLSAIKHADIFGSTMYRVVWLDTLERNFTYPLPPSFFRAKQTFARWFGRDIQMIVIELQGESWHKKMTYELTVEEQYASMNPERFRNTLKYASRTGFDTFYLWGVEWWYWLKKTQNMPEMWNIAKEAIQPAQKN
ncbi:MAG: cellulase family glycosylhydrolase [Candidatus Niyogibacteria bacterium]|nr:cellulase family glycosylhydrolase [Candidatus Niyogibacteria bacterium]